MMFHGAVFSAQCKLKPHTLFSILNKCWLENNQIYGNDVRISNLIQPQFFMNDMEFLYWLLSQGVEWI